MIDHEYTEEITCPHCGHEDINSWEALEGEDGHLGIRECGECGEPFHATRHVRVSYSTEIAKETK